MAAWSCVCTAPITPPRGYLSWAIDILSVGVLPVSEPKILAIFRGNCGRAAMDAAWSVTYISHRSCRP